MKKFTIILEDNFDKFVSVLDKYRYGNRDKFKHDAIIYCSSEQDALLMIDSIITRALEPVKFTLFIDGELAPGSGSGLSFLNRMIGDYLEMIQEVILISMSTPTRREMQEICVENLLAVELMPLPFSGGSPD